MANEHFGKYLDPGCVTTMFIPERVAFIDVKGTVGMRPSNPWRVDHNWPAKGPVLTAGTHPIESVRHWSGTLGATWVDFMALGGPAMISLRELPKDGGR